MSINKFIYHGTYLEGVFFGIVSITQPLTNHLSKLLCSHGDHVCGCVWLCVVICGYRWLCVVVCGCVVIVVMLVVD